MAYHIERAQKLDPSKKVYFAGGSRWTDNYEDKKSFSTKAAATAATKESSSVITGTRTGVGFRGASVVSN